MNLSQAITTWAETTQGLEDTQLVRPWQWGAYEEGVRFAFFRTYEELRHLAVELAVARQASGPAVTVAQQALAQYHAAFYDLLAVALLASDAVLDRPPAEGEWPLRVILGHTLAADRGFFAVIWHAITQHRTGSAGPTLISDQETENILGNWDEFEEMMDQASLSVTLANYRAHHRRVLRDLADIGDDEVDLPTLWWEGEPIPIRFRLHRFDSHLRQHTIQAEKTLDALGRRPTEAQRLLRQIFAALAQAEGVLIGAPHLLTEQCETVAAGIVRRAEEIGAIIAG